MKKLLSIVLLFLSLNSFGQKVSNAIIYKKAFWSFPFFLIDSYEERDSLVLSDEGKKYGYDFSPVQINQDSLNNILSRAIKGLSHLELGLLGVEVVCAGEFYKGDTKYYFALGVRPNPRIYVSKTSYRFLSLLTAGYFKNYRIPLQDCKYLLATIDLKNMPFFFEEDKDIHDLLNKRYDYDRLHQSYLDSLRDSTVFKVDN